MDVNGARLKGLINHRENFGARVVWAEGTLYVLKSLTDVAVFTDVAMPVRWGGGWKARVGESSLQIMKPGCSCKKDPALGALSVDDIVSMGARVG